MNDFENQPKIQCPNCGSYMPQDASFCGACGARLGKKCSRCGLSVRNDIAFCPSCGNNLNSQMQYQTNLQYEHKNDEKPEDINKEVEYFVKEIKRKRPLIYFAESWFSVIFVLIPVAFLIWGIVLIHKGNMYSGLTRLLWGFIIYLVVHAINIPIEYIAKYQKQQEIYNSDDKIKNNFIKLAKDKESIWEADCIDFICYTYERKLFNFSIAINLANEIANWILTIIGIFIIKSWKGNFFVLICNKFSQVVRIPAVYEPILILSIAIAIIEIISFVIKKVIKSKKEELVAKITAEEQNK